MLLPVLDGPDGTHNVIAFIGSYDEATHTFTKENVQLMDGGIDFYATQTTLAPDGRRIMTCLLYTSRCV